MSKIEVAIVSLMLKTKTKQAMRYFYNCLTALLMLCMGSTTLHAIDYTAYSTENTVGTNYVSADSTIMTYARPSEYTLLDGSPRFNVLINGEAYTGLYDANNAWGGNVSFGYFDFKDGTPVEVVISCRKSLGNYHLLPVGAEVSNVEKITDKILKFTISKANQNITLVLDGDYQTGDVLHLFCNDIIKAPNVASKEGYSYDRKTKTYYFGPGYYDLTDKFGGTLMVAGARSIYLAGGADVAGITLHGHRAQCWQVIVDHCHNVEMKNVKIISTRYASTDGLDVVNSEQCAFLGMFIRASDDAVAIKGLGGNHPADNAPSRNLTFCNMQLWNDCNNAFGIGAENHCAFYEHIRLMNSSILFSYDDPNYHEQLDERAAMGICCIHGTYFRDILFDNVDVYHCERLIALGFHPDFWFGALKGDQTTPGGMQRITFSHINVLSNSGSRIANKINLKAWRQPDTPPKDIDSVAFNHVIIDGHQLQNTDDSCFSETNFEGIHHLQFQ